MPDLIITEALVERCARAMYEASIADAGPHHATWDDLPAYWRAVLTTQARACLTAALHPTPTRGPLDGQEPLIGETTWS